MGRKKQAYKHRTQRIHHRGTLHKIYGKVLGGSIAEYLLLKQKMNRMSDGWMLSKFKKGEQLLFNTKFVQGILDEYKELHCEFCGKPKLKLFYWWENANKVDRKIMATADHFYPKSFDKERLSMDMRNLVVACDDCNNKKSNGFVHLDALKFPYDGTTDKLEQIADELQIKTKWI
jgi:hypothetical protein